MVVIAVIRWLVVSLVLDVVPVNSPRMLLERVMK